jgi:hypothetical protein
MIRQLDLIGRSVLGRGQRALARQSEQTATTSAGSLVASRTTLVVFSIALAALLVRWAVISGESFPVNDGGLFMAMIDDLRAADFALPKYTDYNQLEIPFAYPPLPFYLGAAVAEWTPLDTADVLRVIPLVASTLTVVAVYPLARRLLRTLDAAVLATFLFALTPRAFNWEIMGGGLTRSLGLLFAVLTLGAALEMFEQRRRRDIVLTAVLAGLTALSHLEMAAFVVVSGVLFYLARDRSRLGLMHGVAVGALATAFAAPWWIAVLARHGVSPFVAAAQAGQWDPLIVIRLLTLTLTDSPLIDLVAVFGLIGFFVALRQRAWLLPVWALVIFAVDPRKAATLAVIPAAMLAAIALIEVVLPALLRSDEEGVGDDAAAGEPAADPAGTIAPAAPESTGAPSRAPASWFAVTITLIMTVNAILSGSVAPSLEASATQGLEESEREAFAWISANTATESAFVVLSSANNWPSDRASEWFPALTDRRSIATVQGTEWLPDREFTHAIERYQSLQRCGDAGLDCLLTWEAEFDQSFSYVLLHSRPGTQFTDEKRPVDIERDCCGTLREQLGVSTDFRLAYSNDSVWLFERVSHN